jgi:hypothetical protein
MSRPSIQHIPVIYLVAVPVTTIVHILETKLIEPGPLLLINILAGTLLTHLALSLLINTYATFIIGLKAWCVHLDRVIGKYFTDCSLIDNAMRAYIQEIPQVADRKRYRYPNP